MSLFEFLMVLLSIIIGLGMAEILNGVAGMIRSRANIRPYWVHTVLVGGIFLALLQQWWEIWGLRVVPEWTFSALLLLLAGPVGLYLIAHLLFPAPIRNADMQSHYFGDMRPVWWLGSATVILATAFRPLVFGQPLIGLENATSLLFLGGFLTLGITRRPGVHAALVPLFVLLLMVDIVQWSFIIDNG